jgi:3-phenylpropionate/trans-cinnamate dioxygenase ferredoxin reductase component
VPEQTFVIVGASLAGVSAAEELRKQGFDGRVVLVGAESHYPYIRPPLSKDYLAGKVGLDEVFVHASEWYDDHAIEEHLDGTVKSIDRASHMVSVSNGESFRYDKLLLATGSRPRVLDVPGAELHGVHYLRTLDDSAALAAAIGGGGQRVVVIGSGWVGLEVAATARTLGNEVRILERGSVPLSNALGDELGGYFAELHRRNGVELQTGVDVVEVVGKAGAAAGVRVGQSDVFGTDLVVVGIGAQPNVELAEAAGLQVDNGVLVDAALRTSDPDIFAAGDIANELHPVLGQRLRVEHWANAQNQGPAAARSMLDQAVSFDDIPYFYTDQFDLGMEYSGYGSLAADGTVVYRGDPESGAFIAFWVAEDRVVAGMNVNVWDVNEAIQGIIRSGKPVDVAQLADPDVDLATL